MGDVQRRERVTWRDGQVPSRRPRPQGPEKRRCPISKFCKLLLLLQLLGIQRDFRVKQKVRCWEDWTPFSVRALSKEKDKQNLSLTGIFQSSSVTWWVQNRFHMIGAGPGSQLLNSNQCWKLRASLHSHHIKHGRNSKSYTAVSE